MHSPIYWWVHFYIKNKKGANNGSTLVCTWFCGNNNRCTRNRKTYHQKLKSEVKMFGLIMTLTAKVAKPLPKADKTNTSFVMRECDNADVIRHRKLKRDVSLL